MPNRKIGIGPFSTIVTEILNLRDSSHLHSVHANLRDLSPETMSANTSIPMHPAAEKFFRELKK